MKLTLAILLSTTLAACASYGPHSSYTAQRYPGADPQKRKQCEYQATLATAGYTRIDDSAIAAWKRLEIIDMCMAQ